MTDPLKPARADPLPEEPPVTEAAPEDLFAAAPDVEAEPQPAELEPESEPEAIFAAEPEPEIPEEIEPIPIEEPEEPAYEEPDAPEPVIDEPEPEPPFDHGPEPWEAVPPPAPVAPAPKPRLVEPEVLPRVEPVRDIFSAPPRERLAEDAAPPEPKVTAAPGAAASAEEKRMAFAIYLLYLASLMLVFPALIGGYFAFRARKEQPEEWLDSHYIYQLRTLWTAVAGLVVGFGLIMLPFGLGPLALMALVVWVTLRCFVGMVRLHRGEPIYNPRTWTV